VIAQQVEEVIPSAVVQDQKTKTLSVSYSDLTANLIGAVQTLSRKVDMLEEKLRKN